MPSKEYYGLSFKEAEKRNRQNVCSVEGCDRHRHGMSKYCPYHIYRDMYYGHPEQKGLMPWEYKQELKEVSEVIDRNRNHKGIRKALAEIDAFLTMADVSIHMPAAIKRLKQSTEVTPLDILKEAAAVTLLYYRQANFVHNKLLVNDETFRIALGYRCLALVKKEVYRTTGGRLVTRTTSKKARRALGDFLWNKLGLLLINIQRSIQSREDREEAKQKAFAAPLV